MEKELQKSGHMEVTPKQSEILQKHLFYLGYSWWYSRRTDICNTEEKYIYWDYHDKGISYSHESYTFNNRNPLHKYEDYFNINN